MKRMSFGEYISLDRISRSRSQRDLARLVGVTPGHISKIESGEHIPSIPVFYDLCVFSGMSPNEVKDYLFELSMKKRRCKR